MNVRKLLIIAVENWPAKVLSIGLAIILFVFHRMSSLETRFFSVPLNIEHNGPLLPSNPYPRMIRVSLRGEANSIFPILEEDIEVYVDMNKLDVPGVYAIPIQWRKKGTAQGVDPLQITVDPMEIILTLDHRISKVVPLAASLRGQVETGYTMTSYSLSPSQITIEGPAELIWSISEIFTETIDLEGRRNDFFVTASIMNRDPLMIVRGNGISEFHGIIRQIIPVRTITGVPIAITGLSERFTGELDVKTGSIRLEGENQANVDRFEPAPNFLSIDCSGINEPGTYVLKVISGAAGNMRARAEPEEIKVHINRAAGAGRP